MTSSFSKGHQCGSWTVVSDEIIHKGKGSRAHHRCRCRNCGITETLIRYDRLDPNSVDAATCCRSCSKKDPGAEIHHLSGRRIGKWAVGREIIKIGRLDIHHPHGKPAYECTCDCGSEHVVDAGSLVREEGGSRGCMDCFGIDRRLTLPIGHKCNSWTVISDELILDKGFYKQLCQCECGSRNLIEPTRLDRNNKQSRNKCRTCWGAWTPEEDSLLRNDQNATLSYCPLSVPGRSEIAITKRRLKLGIPSLFHLDQNLTIDDIDNVTLQLILGSILGDGCITTTVTTKGKCRDSHFEEFHHGPQNDYTTWKAGHLSIFHARAKVVTRIFRDQKTGATKRVLISKLRTKNHRIFTDLRPLIYREDMRQPAKYFIHDLFQRMDLLGLMIWYLDDGTNGGKSTSSIAAKGWKRPDLDKLCESLNEKYGLSLHVTLILDDNPGENKNVCIPAATRDIVFPIWQQYARDFNLPDCMLYKLKLRETKFKHWTPEEDDILLDNPKATIQELRKILRRRNHSATQHRKNRLGITVIRKWTPEEDRILCNNPNASMRKLLEVLPGRTEKSIECRKVRLRIKQAKNGGG
jgi:hypothetical protein